MRLDTGFVGKPYNSGNQIEHLLFELREAYASIFIKSSSESSSESSSATLRDVTVPMFQVFYQPAMNMHSSNRNYRAAVRVEEGLAVIVRCHRRFHETERSFNKNDICPEIVLADYLLLPRSFTDPHDDHQRLMQHIRLRLPHGHEVDVYNTHLSLSDKARENSLSFFTRNLAASLHAVNRVQILVGDFNAEPHETSILALVTNGDKSKDSNDSILSIEMSVEGTPVKRNSKTFPLSFFDFDHDKKYTFPVNNPDKRIDYILGLNSSSTHVRAIGDVELIGIQPYEVVFDGIGRHGEDGTLEERKLLGVFEPKSVLWPSDVSP